MLKYNEFLFEKKKKKLDERSELDDFVYSKEFGETLAKIKNDDVVKTIVVSYENMKSKYTFIDSTDKDDIVTFLYASISKELKDDDDPWSHPQRQEIKVGRLAHKLFKGRYDDMEIYSFVNKYKSVIREKSTILKLVSGRDIIKYYSVEFSESTGILGNSCMRHDRCQDYLDLYADNPSKIKMLTLFDKKNLNICIGRALIWKLDNHNSYLMDSIYTSNDSDSYIFRRYASLNGIYLTENDDSKYGIKDVFVQLKPKEYEFYPYLDTLFLYQPATGIITDNINNIQTQDDVYILDDIFGTARLYER
jgi:hypothetical protein